MAYTATLLYNHADQFTSRYQLFGSTKFFIQRNRFMHFNGLFFTLPTADGEYYYNNNQYIIRKAADAIYFAVKNEGDDE